MISRQRNKLYFLAAAVSEQTPEWCPSTVSPPKLSVALRTKQTQPTEGPRRDGVAFMGSGSDSGGVRSLMDWEELAGSCSTPGGK